MSARLPFLVVVHSCMDHAAAGRSREQDLGQPKIRMQARFAKGGVPPGAHPKSPVAMLPSLLVFLARGLLGGRAQPSPFFDAAGQPRVAPVLIEKAERETLRARVLAGAS